MSKTSRLIWRNLSFFLPSSLSLFSFFPFFLSTTKYFWLPFYLYWCYKRLKKNPVPYLKEFTISALRADNGSVQCRGSPKYSKKIGYTVTRLDVHVCSILFISVQTGNYPPTGARTGTVVLLYNEHHSVFKRKGLLHAMIWANRKSITLRERSSIQMTA